MNQRTAESLGDHIVILACNDMDIMRCGNAMNIYFPVHIIRKHVMLLKYTDIHIFLHRKFVENVCDQNLWGVLH